MLVENETPAVMCLSCNVRAAMALYKAFCIRCDRQVTSDLQAWASKGGYYPMVSAERYEEDRAKSR